MTLVLKTPTQLFPPSGFSFTDPKTGMSFNGLESGPAQTALKIREHRLGNPHIYPATEPDWFDADKIVQEIYGQKFQTMPELFVGGPDEASPRPPVDLTHGYCICGEWERVPVYCPTCGSGNNVVVSYKCKNCGTERP